MMMKPLRLLLADADADVRRGLRSIVESHEEWEVSGEAATGADAVEQVREQRPDTVLLDVALPETDGLQTAREILREWPRTPILLLATQPSDELSAEAARAGARAVVLKTDAQRIAAALQAVERDLVHLAGRVVGQARHVGAFFSSDAERYDILCPFVAEGLARGERALYIVNGTDDRLHRERLGAAGIGVAQAAECGQLYVAPWEDMYLQGGSFDQYAMTERLQTALRAGKDDGFSMTRLVAHMEWALDALPGVEDLVEYESRLNHVLPSFDDVVVCAYDVTKFGAAVIVDAMRAHPAVVIGGTFGENPFYVPPDRLLDELRQRPARLDH